MSEPSCWCWQYGRCLVDCPTAGHPRPRPFTDATWKAAALELMHPRHVPDQEDTRPLADHSECDLPCDLPDEAHRA